MSIHLPHPFCLVLVDIRATANYSLDTVWSGHMGTLTSNTRKFGNFTSKTQCYD